MLRRWNINLIFTGRGVLLALLSAYFITGPSLRHSDVVASIIGYSIAGIILLTGACTFFFGLRLRRSMEVHVSAPADEGQPVHGEQPGVYAQSIARFFIRIAPVRLPPLFVISFSTDFFPRLEIENRHTITGSLRKAHLLADDVIFPHRGEWTLRSIRFRVGDQFGLTSFRWTYPDAHSMLQMVRVAPPPSRHENLPVFSSARRAGDLVSDKNIRMGDPYDLKPYHPSDGLRKIAWKVYARRGELVSRHAEPATMPEGKVLIFVLADEWDDKLCATAVEYVRQIAAQDVDALVGCEGMRSRPIAAGDGETEDLLIASVWDAAASFPESARLEVADFMARCKNRLGDSAIEQVLVFVSAERLAREQSVEPVMAVAAYLASERIVPTFFVVGANETLRSRPVPVVRSWLRFFIDEYESPAEASSPGITKAFLHRCMKEQWETVVI